jgi:hypothetical protein
MNPETSATRRQLLKGAGAIGVGALAALAPMKIARAEDDAQGIEGSWLVTVTVRGQGPPPFLSLWSFTPGGVFIATDTINALPQFSASTEHGVWERKGDREVAAAAIKFSFDPSGNFIGQFKGRGVIELAEDFSTWTSLAEVQQFDLTGKLLFSASVDLNAARISV